MEKFVKFLNETDIIHDYIVDCGECDQDMDAEFGEVQTHSAIFSLGDVDSDGQVSVNDALMTHSEQHRQQGIFGKAVYTANVDFVGGVTVKDALLTLQRAVNVIEGF